MIKNVVELDGDSLTCEKLIKLSHPGSRIHVSEETFNVVQGSRNVVDQMLSKRKVAYGINTGFGLFSDVVIDDTQLEQLQLNLIRSHSAGVGEPLSFERTRMLLALRINVLCRGNSGISVHTLKGIIEAFNSCCISVVPCQGTVGASGDLAPLAHLALGLLGEGLMWDRVDGSNVSHVKRLEPEEGKEPVPTDDEHIYDHKGRWEQRPASQVLDRHGCKPIILGPKEGLALINGTQLITALGCEAVLRSRNVQRCADIAAALTLEVLKGTVDAFHPRIHERRPHRGQGIVAARLRALLYPGESSELFQSHKYQGRVQDAYSLRCAPQVHGVALDTIEFVQGILETEANSSGDNPMVFAEPPEVTKFIDGELVHLWPPKRRCLASRKSSLGVANHDATADKVPPEQEIHDLDSAKEEIKRLRAQLAAANGALNSASGSSSLGDKNASSTFYNNHSGFISTFGRRKAKKRSLFLFVCFYGEKEDSNHALLNQSIRRELSCRISCQGAGLFGCRHQRACIDQRETIGATGQPYAEQLTSVFGRTRWAEQRLYDCSLHKRCTCQREQSACASRKL